MEIPVERETMWWCLKAGRGGVLEDDWLDQGIVSTGWGEEAGDFRNMEPSEFRDNDPDDQYQPSKFIGYHDKGIEDGDIVIAYAPEKGHISGVGKVGEIRYEEDRNWRYLSDDEAEDALVQDHYYWRPISWFDWETPIRVSDLSKRYQVNGSDQIPTPMTLNRYGTLADDRDRIETLAQEIHDCETVRSSDGFGPDQESQIQDWLVDNIRTLNLYNPRKEVRTAVGRIDVLADSDDGEVAIEIKYGRAGDQALGQLLGYIGARSKESTSHIDGILVAEAFTSRVKTAVTTLDNVILYELDVSTKLNQV